MRRQAQDRPTKFGRSLAHPADARDHVVARAVCCALWYRRHLPPAGTARRRDRVHSSRRPTFDCARSLALGSSRPLDSSSANVTRGLYALALSLSLVIQVADSRLQEAIHERLRESLSARLRDFLSEYYIHFPSVREQSSSNNPTCQVHSSSSSLTRAEHASRHALDIAGLHQST